MHDQIELPAAAIDLVRLLIRAVDRKQFAVHLDPCNLVNCPERFYQNGKLIDECFEKLGPWISSCHAKDVSWEGKDSYFIREPGWMFGLMLPWQRTWLKKEYW